MNRSFSTALAGVVGVVIGLAVGMGAGMFSSGSDAPNASAESSARRASDEVAGAKELEAPSLAADAEKDASANPAADADAASRAEIASDGVPAAATGTVNGRVLDTDGKPIAGVAVRSTPLFDAEEGTESTRGKNFEPLRSLDEEVQRAVADYKKKSVARAEAISGEDGHFELKGVATGRNWVTAAREGFVFDSAGSSYARAGDTVDLVGSSVVEVPIDVVLPDGRAATRANLTINTERVHNSAELWTSAKPRVFVKPGSYTIRAEIVAAQFKANGVTEECASPAAATPIEIAADHVEKITLELEGRTGIRGTILPNPEIVSGQRLRVACVDVAAGTEFDPKKLRDRNDGAWSSSGGTFEFFDLKPGHKEIVVFVEWRGTPIHHQPVEVTPGVTQATIDLSKMDTSKFILATLTDGAGKPIKATNFNGEIETKRNSNSTEVSQLERRDGKYWLVPDAATLDFLAGKKVDSTMSLDIQTSSNGNKKVPITPGTRAIDVKFGKPAFLEVTIAGYAGSPYEGRIDIQLHKPDADGGRYFYGGQGNNKIKPDGTVRLGPEEPGEYVVQMTTSGEDESRWQQTTLAEQKLTLVEGTNRVTLTIPVLSKLTVIVNGGMSGDIFMQSIPGNDYKNAEVKDGKAVFDNLAPGEYRVTAHDGEKIAVAKVRVPDVTTLTLTPIEPNALAIGIDDANGALAKAGFHDGDLIIGLEGKEFEAGGSMMAFAAIGSKEKSKLLVLRDGKKIELEVAGRDVFRNSNGMGGELMPASH